MDVSKSFAAQKASVKTKRDRIYIQVCSHRRPVAVLGNLCMNMQPTKELKQVAKTTYKKLTEMTPYIKKLNPER